MPRGNGATGKYLGGVKPHEAVMDEAGENPVRGVRAHLFLESFPEQGFVQLGWRGEFPTWRQAEPTP